MGANDRPFVSSVFCARVNGLLVKLSMEGNSGMGVGGLGRGVGPVGTCGGVEGGGDEDEDEDDGEDEGDESESESVSYPGGSLVWSSSRSISGDGGCLVRDPKSSGVCEGRKEVCSVGSRRTLWAARARRMRFRRVLYVDGGVVAWSCCVGGIL